MSVTKVRVCGATGYVGGRLVPDCWRKVLRSAALFAPGKMADRVPWSSNLTVIEGALDDRETQAGR